jgi:hypothetical protein
MVYTCSTQGRKLVGKAEVRRQVVRRGCRYDGSINAGLKGIWCEDVEWINMVRYTVV